MAGQGRPPSSAGADLRERDAARPAAARGRARRDWDLPYQQKGLAWEVGLALICVAAATAARAALGLLAGDIVPFGSYFPAVLVAVVLGGWRGGALAAVLSLILGWFLFLPPEVGFIVPTPGAAVSLALFALSSAAIVALGAFLRGLLDRLRASRAELAETNRRYDAVFESMSEGFALCEAIRDSEGGLADYRVLEMNPALKAMLGVSGEAVGVRLSAAGGDYPAWLSLFERVIRSGAADRFEFHNPATQRWHAIHVVRADKDRMAQFFFDITERKSADARQAQLFDELNHRVKNSLTIVSGFLHIQARDAPPAARAHLLKAVDRVQSVAQVHGALYRGAQRDTVDFAAYLEDLCEGLSQSLIADRRVTLEVHTEPAELPVDVAIPLGMVVNELVTNAVKYAYPEPRCGVVSVRLGRDGEGLELEIGDAGQGLPQDLAGAKGRLGMRLVNSLVAQVGGELVVSRHPGTTFRVRLGPNQANQGIVQ